MNALPSPQPKGLKPSCRMRTLTTWLYFAGLFWIILAAKLWLIGQFGNSTPYWDQWNGEASLFLVPYLEHHLQLASLFDGHCEHRIFFSRVLAIGLLKLNGLWDPKLEMVVQAFIHVACILLFIGLCRQALASYAARLALGLFTTAIFVIPFGWENTLWGFQSQMCFVSLWGLIGIGCCWRYRTLSPGWWLGIASCGLGLISMASGLFAPAVICGLHIVRAAQNRSDWCRQFLGSLVLITIVIAGFLLVCHVPAHDGLKAHSVGQFLAALLKIASWPTAIPWLAPLFQAPVFLLLFWALWQRRPAADPAWLLISLGLWGEAQSLAIAYGRAVGSYASRYADNFTLTLCINCACLLYLFITLNGRPKKALVILGLWWFGVVSGSLVYVSITRLPAEIAHKRSEILTQENNVRAFLFTHDLAAFKARPFLQLPFPDPALLAAFLNHPVLRDILPTNLRDPLIPAHIATNPSGSFGPEDYSPEITGRSYETILGSYNSITGNAATGTIEFNYPAGGRTSWLKMFVAGNPQAPGMSLTLIDERGSVRAITPATDAGHVWQSAVFHRPDGPFTLRIQDKNPAAWLAFTLPREVGPASLASNFLQRIALWLVPLGIALVCLAIRLDPGPHASHPLVE